MIELIRGSRDRDVAREGLMERFGLTHIQAQAILELRLQQLTALEADSIKREHADKVERISELRELLGDEDKVLGLIKEELQEISERYGDERRTEITHAEDDVDIEDLIADQQMVIAITHSGYIKSLPLATYRMQRRGGVGVTGMDMKDDDYIEHLFVCSTHDFLLFFTNRGKVYRSKVYELPEAGRTVQGPLPRQRAAAARGRARAVRARDARLHGVRLPRVRDPARHGQEDRVPGLQHADQGRRHHRHQHPRRGRARRGAARRRRRRGPDGLERRPDACASPRRTRARWAATRPACAAWTCRDDVDVIAMDVARDDQYLLVVTENGFGKRTQVGEYRKTQRGAKGVKTIQQTEAKGRLAGALVVREHHQLVFISQNGMVQRIAVRDIRPLGRNAQGFRLMNIREDDRVSAVALVMEEEASTAAQRRDARPARRSPARPTIPALAEERRRARRGRPGRPDRPGDDHAARGRRGRRRAVGPRATFCPSPSGSVLWR